MAILCLQKKSVVLGRRSIQKSAPRGVVMGFLSGLFGGDDKPCEPDTPTIDDIDVEDDSPQDPNED